jgi:hypothetical protein
MDTRLQVISSAVRNAYGNDRQPSYWFVREALQRDPCRSLVDELSQWYAIENDTDPNDDVSFNFILSRGAGTWRLALSMVGPFALLVRVEDAEKTAVVTESTEPDEARILGVVKAHGFEFIDRRTLNRSLDVRYSGDDDDWTVYHAVFTRSQTIPG